MAPIYRNLILAVAVLAAGCAPPRPSPLPIELGDPPPHDYSLSSLSRHPVDPDTAQPHAPSPGRSTRDPKIPCPPQDDPDHTLFDLRHEAVEPFLDKYLESERRTLETALNRGQAFVPRFQKAMVASGLPPQLAYLPIVESSFKNSARSPAGAVGLWQFMPGTAQRYGLRVERCLDERRDPQLATNAAVQYLGYLYDRFADWHLALAAYNAGEGTVARALRDHDVDDYWAMVSRGLLPRETCNFVPKFLAAVTVAERAPDLGFDLAPDSPSASHHGTFTVKRPLSLTTVAKLARTDVAHIRELNPALQCDRIPNGGYPIRLPADRVADFKVAYANLKTDPVVVARANTHRVRRGESVTSIARRYGVSVGALLKANRIRNPRRLRVNTNLTIPVRRRI